MHFSSIPALVALLCLGASGVLSLVIPETRGVDSSDRILAKDVILCIRDLCAKQGDKQQTTSQCGQVVLTITHLGVSSSVEQCVSYFSYQIAQGDRTFQTKDALYELSLEDNSKPAANEKRAKNKATKPTKAKTTATKTKAPKTTKAKTTAAKTTTSKASLNTSKPSSNIPSVKPSGSKISSKPSGSVVSSIKPTGSKVSSQVSGSATPGASACPLPRKDKNGKLIQRRCAGDQFYKKRDLIAGKVTHWKFNNIGLTKTDNVDADANAKLVLDGMTEECQLDVVKVSSGELTVVGNVNDPEVILTTKRGTDPNSFTKKGGNYLLTNGGFFQHMEMRPNSFEPAGEDTVVKTADGTVMGYENPFPLPPDYAPFYDQIDGIESTRVHSGPDLKKTIPEIDARSGIWRYNENDVNLVGRLSHASEPNERIALVRFGSIYYSIAYTCMARSNGATTNKLKKIIDLFF